MKYKGVHVYLKPVAYKALVNDLNTFENDYGIKLSISDVGRDAMDSFLRTLDTKEKRENYLIEKGFLEQ